MSYSRRRMRRTTQNVDINTELNGVYEDLNHLSKSFPSTVGNTWYSGSSDPSDESGNDGDFYLNTTSWDVFKKISGEWSLQGNIKGVDGSGVSLGLVIALT